MFAINRLHRYFGTHPLHGAVIPQG